LGRQEEDHYTRRLLRGGSWFGVPGLCRSACRYHYHPDDASYARRFACGLPPPGPFP
jgi:formylglycine-generating enzyme required for sulfatase activity